MSEGMSAIGPGKTSYHAHGIELAAQRLRADGRPALAETCEKAAAYLRAMTDAVPAVASERQGGPLQCVHVIGPDDLYAAPDARTATKWAHRINVMAMERLNPPTVNDDDFVLCFANVEIWDGSAEEHAKALPYSIEQMSTPAELAAAPPVQDTTEGRGADREKSKVNPGDLVRNARFDSEGVYPAFGDTAYVQGVTDDGEYLDFGPNYFGSRHEYPRTSFDKVEGPLTSILSDASKARELAEASPTSDSVGAPERKSDDGQRIIDGLNDAIAWARGDDSRGRLLRVEDGKAEDPPNWRDDPSADERWNVGLDFGQEQLCAVLGVDPGAVSWDAATETLDGDVQAVIGNILTAWAGDDWRDVSRKTAPPPLTAEQGE